MKLLIVIALFALAAAEPEADSQYLYNSYNYGAYPYTYNYGAYPYAYNYGAYPYAYNRLFKREAEAEAEPQVFHPYAYNYGAYPYAHTYTHPVVTKVEYKAPEIKQVHTVTAPVNYAYTAPVAAYQPYAYPAMHYAAPVAAKVIPRYHAKSAGGVEHTVLKRSADSEADPFYLYNSYNYGAYPYRAAYNYGAYPYNAAYNYGAYPYAYHY